MRWVNPAVVEVEALSDSDVDGAVREIRSASLRDLRDGRLFCGRVSRLIALSQVRLDMVLVPGRSPRRCCNRHPIARGDRPNSRTSSLRAELRAFFVQILLQDT